ncbi:MAG: phytoene/squalene synthase family protein [Bacteroidota bacterium]|nr:phytoene/squalene synthase family protein [Bacteroidota bacterium]
MNTVELYDQVCINASRNVTRAYSTSFSLGIRSLHPSLRDPIHAIYGFVRFADEIVDTFHDHDKVKLLNAFREETEKAVAEKISLNPILHSFQRVVDRYGIEPALYNTFLDSMAMDLKKVKYDQHTYEQYILGSAEVVGLMCLRVFCDGNREKYDRLKPAAMRLGSAFQKVNFLRDLQDDLASLGRSYFPELALNRMTGETKRQIEENVQKDLDAALIGIRQLPKKSRFGVYLAYVYYISLFQKIRSLSTDRILKERIRLPNRNKFALFTTSYLRHSFGML